MCLQCTLRVATENERIEDDKRDSRVLEEYNLCSVLSWVAVAKYTFWNRHGTVPITPGPSITFVQRYRRQTAWFLGSIHARGNLRKAKERKKRKKRYTMMSGSGSLPSTRLKTDVGPWVTGLRLRLPSGSTPENPRATGLSVDESVDALPGRVSTGCVFTPRYPVE